MNHTTYDGLLMFSGGLDSTIAGHILKSQGCHLLALHFVLPFYSGIGAPHGEIRSFAEALDIPLRIVEEGEAFYAMVRSPQFGFGKNANPCMDCRIHRLKAARVIMEEEHIPFIVTGEVIGQRPMSQRLSCLQLIERRTGLEGRLLRPLSAKRLEPTIPEQNGLVDRSRLLDWSGRSRQPQLRYARNFGLRHTPPAGGCILTNELSAGRYLTLVKRFPEMSLKDFRLIAYGRHFILDDRCRVVIARDDPENDVIEQLAGPEDLLFDCADTPGPLGIGRGEFDEPAVFTVAAMVARYSRARSEKDVRVRVYRTTGEEKVVTVAPATPEQCEALRI